MDALNLQIRDALQMRARLGREIAAVKRTIGLPLPDAERERAMLAAIGADPGEGFDAAALRRIFQVVFDETRRAIRESDDGDER